MLRALKRIFFNEYLIIALSMASILAVRLTLEPIIPRIIQDTLTLALGILYEALPFIFLGVGLSVAIQQFLSQKTLHRLLPKRGFLRRPLLAIIGVFLPVCECGNVPLARGLIAKGLKPSEVLTFLFAAPIINPVTIYTTMQAFQGNNQVVVIRVLAAFLIAVGVGWLFAKAKQSHMITTDFQHYCDSHAHINAHVRSSLKSRVQRYADSFADETSKLLPSLVGGSLVAGIIQTAVPRTILTSLSQQPLLAILALIALAFVVSICANVDAFFALSLASIFPVSAIIAFLVFGPMIDIKMLALLKTTFRPRVLVVSSLFIFLASLFTGLVVAYAL